MASYLAIAAVATTVLRLLEEQCPRDEFTGTPTFNLYQGHDFNPVTTEGFSLFLYRVTVSSVVRNPPWQRGQLCGRGEHAQIGCADGGGAGRISAAGRSSSASEVRMNSPWLMGRGLVRQLASVEQDDDRAG